MVFFGLVEPSGAWNDPTNWEDTTTNTFPAGPPGGGSIAGSPFGLGWNVVGAGDFLANGHTDLVYQRQSDVLVEIQYLNGNTAVGGGAIANSPFAPGWAVIRKRATRFFTFACGVKTSGRLLKDQDDDIPVEYSTQQ